MGSPALPQPPVTTRGGPPSPQGRPGSLPGTGGTPRTQQAAAPQPGVTNAAPCIPVPSLNLPCARLAGTVGPEDVKTAYATRKNEYQDVLLVQRLINKVANDGYVASSVLGTDQTGKVTNLPENGLPSVALWNAIKQIELLYFYGRANPHGIAVIDPQADESLFTFLVSLANGSEQAKKQLSVQMKALAVAMIPRSRVKIDAGGTAPDGSHVPAKVEAVDFYLPILLDALTQWKLNDTDMVLIALACVATETGNFVPINEPMYDLNTTGTFTDKATGATWTDTPAGVHSGYGTLLHHYNAALNPNPRFPLRGTETFTPNTSGPDGATVKGDIYDSYVDGKGRTINANGNTQPGDGWKYRGRGLIQLTGRGRYKEADEKVHAGTVFIDDPDAVNDPKYAGAVVAGFLGAAETRIRLAMKNNDLRAVRKIVNGGDNGLDPFKVAMAAGRRVIAAAVIQQAKAVTRARRTHHHGKPAHGNAKKATAGR